MILTYTFLPCKVEEGQKPLWINAAHIESIQGDFATVIGIEGGRYTLAYGWANPDRQMRIGIDPDAGVLPR